jgi:phenylpropionate dioxygenase-like ring-hydroxylating dioxygenase large terminal subunit
MAVLSEIRKSLPASWYYDPEQYRRELDAIWYRDWICVGREESVATPGDYFVAGVGDQSVIVTRNAEGGLRAFHNTCRHRGSLLCRQEQGRFRNGRIICPYHTWTYSTDGELLATPGRIESGGFSAADYSLYRVHVSTWRGFVFINLAGQPASDLAAFLGAEAGCLEHWPLESLRIVHRETRQLACNWKIFWENFSECYHCPRVHPELCRVMPVYRQAVTHEAELPGWQPAHDGDDGGPRTGNGAQTWALDGRRTLPTLAGLTDDDIEKGVAFAAFTASMFIVAHPDYLRSVRIFPSGPECIELVVDWLLPETTQIRSDGDLAPILELARIVIRQDGEVCELNQRGLHSRSHSEGVLVAQENDLWDFHEWLRGRLSQCAS